MANLINRRAGGRLLRGVLNESSELNESNEYLIKQVGGYFEEYATDGPPLTFLTVKGAGHMVPKVLTITTTTTTTTTTIEKENARPLLQQ